MPFILPFLPAIIAGAAGVGGLVEGAQAGGRQQQALTQQEQIANQEMQDKQQIFNQLVPFFQQYLGAGSPFLSRIQSAAAGTEAQSGNNAAGAVRQGIASSGTGYGPSGATAAALGGVASNQASTSASNYLTNLLNNESLKFQAAQGLNSTGSMVGSPQNQPNVSAQLPYQSLGSGLTGLAQILNSLGISNTNQVPGSAPGSPTITTNSGGIPGVGPGGIPTPVPQIPFPGSTTPNSAQNFPIPGVPTGGAPTAQGWAT